MSAHTAADMAATLRGLSVIAEGPTLRALSHGKRFTLASVASAKLTTEGRAGLAALLVAAPELLEALRELMNYAGGWDAPKAHPCGKARDLLARLE